MIIIQPNINNSTNQLHTVNLDLPPSFDLYSPTYVSHSEYWANQLDYPPSYEIIFPQKSESDTNQNISPVLSSNSSCKSIYNLLCNFYIDCYRTNSPDSRCCGICYNFNRLKDPNYYLEYKEPCECCLPTIKEYCNSGYIITQDSVSGDCTLCCLPFKIPLFMPCLLGTILNQCINCMRDTNTNYLF